MKLWESLNFLHIGRQFRNEVHLTSDGLHRYEDHLSDYDDHLSDELHSMVFKKDVSIRLSSAKFHLTSDNLHLRKMVLCSCQKYQISDNPQIIYINLMLTCQILMSDMRIACQIYFNLCITSSYNIHAYSTLVRCEDNLSDLLQIV